MFARRKSMLQVPGDATSKKLEPHSRCVELKNNLSNLTNLQEAQVKKADSDRACKLFLLSFSQVKLN